MKQSGDRKPAEDDCQCRCSLPSLGQLQKKFLTLIAKLFYKHGKFVSTDIMKTEAIKNIKDLIFNLKQCNLFPKLGCFC